MSKNKKRILIVEDAIDYRLQLARYLSQEYEIMEAGSLEEALLFLNKKTLPDIIVTDIRLDDGDINNRDGLILLDKIKKLQSNIPVIVMTAYGESQLIVFPESGKSKDARSLGAFDVISKPFKLSQLEDLIEAAISSRVNLKKKIYHIMKVWLPPILVFFIFILLWELMCKLFKIQVFLIPPPSKIISSFSNHFSEIMIDTGITVLEAFLGFLIANIFSLFVAVGFCHIKWFERSFYPYVIALKSVPVIAIAPLLVLWFKYGIWSKVVMAAIISFFPLVVNATQGLKSVDQDSYDLMRSLSASTTQILLKLRFPTAMPHIFSALKISATLSVVGAIVGELTGPEKGIGRIILNSSYNIDTPMLFAAIFAASLAGILFFGLVAWVEKIVSKKYNFNIIK